MFLTEQNMKELTGRVRPCAQIRWLKDNDWPFEINALGHPVVLRSVAVAKLGGNGQDDGPRLRLDDEAA